VAIAELQCEQCSNSAEIYGGQSLGLPFRLRNLRARTIWAILHTAPAGGDREASGGRAVRVLGSDREPSPGRCASARVAGGHDPARRSGSETPLTARRGPADRCGHLDRGGRLTPAGARGAQRDVDRGGGRALPARGGARARLDGEVPEVGKAPGEPQPGSLRAPAQVIGTADLDRRAIVQRDVGVVSAPRGSTARHDHRRRKQKQITPLHAPTLARGARALRAGNSCRPTGA
jgi:hypothetical protein